MGVPPGRARVRPDRRGLAMVMRPGLRAAPAPRQVQRLALTPTMRLSLQMLRLPLADLVAEVTREAAENPFLEVVWPAAGSGRAGGGDAYDLALMTVAAQPSLVEDLRRQLALMVLPAPVAALADYLVGELRDDGYLDTSLEDCAARLGAGADEMAAALAAIQACEPAGVGARDLAECLALQLREHGLPEEMIARVLAHLARFGTDSAEGLAGVLAVTPREARRLASIVRGLRARPVLPGGGAAVAPPLHADLTVTRDNRGALSVRAARGAMPLLRLNEALLARAGQGDFTDRCRDRGLALIRALAERGRTLERIGGALVEAQHRFFAMGPDHLVPLSRSALARQLGVHPSTVGRAMAGKALDHGGRLYPLSMFFSVGLGAEGAADAPVSARVVRLALARIVAQEDPDAPLSDAMICASLRAEGVDITRRTVAKYRGCLAIPSSYERYRRNRWRHSRPGTPDSSPIATA